MTSCLESAETEYVTNGLIIEFQSTPPPPDVAAMIVTYSNCRCRATSNVPTLISHETTIWKRAQITDWYASTFT